MPRDNILYDILKVWPNIRQEELDQHYRMLALKLCYEQYLNPEVEEKFKAITKAYEILSNANMRQVYDDGGMEAIKQYNK